MARCFVRLSLWMRNKQQVRREWMGIGLARGYTFKKNAWGSYSMWEVFWVQPADTRDLGTQAPEMWGYRVDRKPSAKKPAVPKKLKQLRGQLESI